MLIREMDAQQRQRNHTNCGWSMRIGLMISQLSLYRSKICLMNDDDHDDGMIQYSYLPTFVCLLYTLTMSHIHHI